MNKREMEKLAIDKDQTEPETTTKREKFAKSIDFVFACCGNCIGFGNVWKFPFLCYKNGGGAFLIPYFTACFVIAIPIFVLESSVGQFMSEGGMGAWKICPLFQGIGLATSVIVFLQACTYNLILAWAFYYFFSSFNTKLPWSHCDNSWNTVYCTESHLENTTQLLRTNNSYTNEAAPNANSSNYTTINVTMATSIRQRMDPVTEFWQYKVLSVSEGIEYMGGIKWDLCLCLLLSWIVVYFVIWKGIKLSGKVIYVTVTAPYILMIVLLIRGVTLNGAIDGIKYYLKPNLAHLAKMQVIYVTVTAPYILMIVLQIRGVTLNGAIDGIKYYLKQNLEQHSKMQVWADAGYQVTFSYGLGYGIHTVFGSYNKFNHKTYRDCFVYAGMNTFTSFLSGFIIFSVLGFMAKKQSVPISEVAESGPGLAFIAYPEAVAQLPAAPIWSAIFFLMLLFLGIDSQFGHVETFSTATMDLFPRYLRRKRRRELFVGLFGHVETFSTATMDLFPRYLRRTGRRELFVGLVCAGSFLLSLPMVTEGGVYVFLLVDFYVVNNTLFIVILLETLVISYCYGVDRFLDNIEIMYGLRLTPFKIGWMILTPLSITAMLVFGIITYSDLTYEGKGTTYYYPSYCRVIGWVLTCSSIILIPGVAAYNLWTAKGSFIQRLKFTLKPVLKKHQIGPGENLGRINYIDDEQLSSDVANSLL